MIVKKEQTVSIFWSKSAVKLAGSEISTLKSRILEETAWIMPQAKDHFLHTIRASEADRVYLVRGVKDDDRWEIVVQIGQYRPLQNTKEIDPKKNFGKKMYRYPEPIDEPDNIRFSLRDDINYGSGDTYSIKRSFLM